MKEEDKIIIPSDLNDEDYKDFLDVNFETCPQCGEYLHDDEVNTHDCGIEPKLENSFYKVKEYDGNAISDAHCAECNRPLTNFEADNGSCCCEDCENK
ncbi:hypothetical protein GNP80_03685 [Aliivibrio fischeri]|uniref:hypothetical protein n=1 Tax=Aliivibrio fischeri TaxID=668 RepID=UPI0012D8AC47|nr:hypothetical protein [Aliivibrio fischeri]MUK91552.1 hypothetical protein [Aliivibrio fischeri]